MWTSLRFICLISTRVGLLKYHLIILSSLQKSPLVFRVNSKFHEMAFQNWLLFSLPPPQSLLPTNPMLKFFSVVLPLLLALHRPLLYLFSLPGTPFLQHSRCKRRTMDNSMPPSNVSKDKVPWPFHPSIHYHPSFYLIQHFL